MEFFGGGPGGVAGDEPELLGTYSGGWFVVIVSPYDVFRREITIKGSFAEINSFPSALAALRGGRAKTDGIITHRFPLEDYGKALDTLRSDKTAHKVIIVL